MSTASLRRRVMIAVLWVFGRMPRPVRRGVIRAVSPKYTVGSLCIVQRADRSVLLVRHSYNRRWGTVGGLAKHGEAPDVAAVREAFEEVGIEVALVGEPAVIVLPHLRRVDVVYLARPAQEASAEDASPRSAEILEARWFAAGELPALSADTASAWTALARAGLIEPPGRT
ncbi:MAG: NUDIX domain-containing protein [Microthrixaceae bacterium]|nr:NUDIX domain-containing protein [Microthrixaceae bacterium]MCO5319698.1 NUDIX domain-containing protein [Microthrixaceae bacterium]